jgi:hypothetical protein
VIGNHIKRLLGVGNRVQPITADDVEAAKPNPAAERKMEVAKKQLVDALVNLEDQSIAVRKLLANEVLDLVARPGKRK